MIAVAAVAVGFALLCVGVMLAISALRGES